MNRPKAASYTRGSIVRLFGLNFASEVAGQATAFLVGVYLARALNTEAFGAWVFATAILGFLAVLVDGGTEVWGAREVSARSGSLRYSLVAVMRLRALHALLALLILLGIALTSTDLRRWALLFGSGSILAIMVQTNWAHRALHSVAPAATTLLQRLLMLAAVLLLVRAPDAVTTVTFWQGATELFAALILLATLLARRSAGSLLDAAPTIGKVLPETLPLGASRLMRNIPPTLGVAILGYLAPHLELGAFGAAQRLAVVLLIVAAVYNLVTFPVIARASSRGPGAEGPVILASMRLLAFLVMPVCVGGILLAGPLLRSTFTAAYARDVLPLQLLFLTCAAQSLSDNLRRIQHARRQVRSDLVRVGAVTVATATMLFLLAPGGGATGAAVALLIGELLMLGMAWQGLNPAPPLSHVLRAIAEPFALAALMALCVLPFRGQPLAVPLLLGAAVYVALLLLRASVIRRDLRTLELHGPASRAHEHPPDDAEPT